MSARAAFQKVVTGLGTTARKHVRKLVEVAFVARRKCRTGGIVARYTRSMRTSISTRFTAHVTKTAFPGVSFLIQDALFELDHREATSTLSKPASNGMAKRDTKSKGDISELVVAVALTRAGYAVSKPLGENQRYDLIADDGERLHRVQVKTGRVRGGVVKFSCCSTHGHRRTGNLATRPYTGQIELLAVYCPESGKVYVVPEAELTRSGIHLRLVPPQNNMTKTIRWASTYELA